MWPSTGQKKLECAINIDMNSIRLCDDTLLAVIAEFNRMFSSNPMARIFVCLPEKAGPEISNAGACCMLTFWY